MNEHNVDLTIGGEKRPNPHLTKGGCFSDAVAAASKDTTMSAKCVSCPGRLKGNCQNWTTAGEKISRTPE